MITNVNSANDAKWCAILPIKGGAQAKSRLGSNAKPAELANEFAKRTLTALLACSEVENVNIVTADEQWLAISASRITTYKDPGNGLNAAICAARDQMFENQYLVVVPSDLPLLDAAELACVLTEARAHSRAFVRDKDGDGTTLLTALKAEDLIPLYGRESAAAHLKSGASELAAGLSVRFDVDTLFDLTYLNRMDGNS
ncbi:MAG TPA: 2-phospho-L-lactate guanylyltransferase [Candidatus Nanopelagicaceae bacterium]|nr:2-phospho-L-lactate guanylyltransferase [Candidatus Nanopelagicaceae bacterium]